MMSALRTRLVKRYAVPVLWELTRLKTWIEKKSGIEQRLQEVFEVAEIDPSRALLLLNKLRAEYGSYYEFIGAETKIELFYK